MDGRLDDAELPTLAQILLNGGSFLLEDYTKTADWMHLLLFKEGLQTIQQELESLYMGVLHQLVTTIVLCLKASPHDSVVIEMHL